MALKIVAVVIIYWYKKSKILDVAYYNIMILRGIINDSPKNHPVQVPNLKN